MSKNKRDIINELSKISKVPRLKCKEILDQVDYDLDQAYKILEENKSEFQSSKS